MDNLVLQFITILMLSLVGGIVLWLHRRLDNITNGASKLPKLTKQMADAITAAREEMTALQQEIKTTQPKLDKQLSESRKYLQELDFLTDRAEKILIKLDVKFTQIKTLEPPQIAAPVLPKNIEAKVEKSLSPTQPTASTSTSADIEAIQTQMLKMPTSKAEQALKKALDKSVVILISFMFFASPAFAQNRALETPEEVAVEVAPREYSPAEIKLLQELDVERIKLVRRAQALELREKLVDLAEERLSKKVTEMRSLQDKLETLLKNLSTMDDDEISQLARVYEAMKPASAATIMNKLDNAIVYDLFKRMNSKKVAKIMESLAVAKSRFLSEMLAEESELPELE